MKETVCIFRNDLRESGKGVNPVSEKVQKITLEWQTEQISQ